MASFYIPLSGLNSDSTALNTIANNLSNMNTTAYKAQTTNFSDLFYQQVGASGSGNEVQVGGGVKVASNSVDYTQGSFNTSGTTTSDVALDGNGFFLVNDGGTNLLTRDGTFTQDNNGNLITSDGLNVMGYPAVNGVVNTSAALAPISIPLIGQVQQPQATTSFGMNATLDSSAEVGTSVKGQVEVYDSLGNGYEATVDYTKTGTNEWSYSVSLPDSLKASPATAAAATTLPVNSAAATGSTNLENALTAVSSAAGVTPVTQSSSAASGVTTLSYNLSTTAGTLGTVDQASTSLKITGTGGSVTVPPAGPNETAFQYANDITTAMAGAGVTGVTVTGNATTGQLSFAGTTGAFTVTGNMSQDLAGGTTNNYTFNTGGTVDPTTNLTITGQTAGGVSATITAPTVTAGETMATYANDLNSAISAAGIVNVTATANPATNQLSIVGANLTTSNNLNQGLAATTTNYDFGPSATVNPGASLKITGQTASGATATTALPSFTGMPETVADYAADLTTALNNAHIVGVKVTSNGGQLSIVGANSSIAGSVNQNLTATTISYNLGTGNGTVATIDPTTSLTITGQTTSGASATIAAPTVESGETVSQYADALNAALATAGVSGVSVSSTAGGQLSITGANVSTSGNLVQDPVSSAAAGGTLTFDSGGNLVSPAANVSGISFTGLSDGASPLNMTWNIMGTSGTPTISQVDTGTNPSSTSAGPQNGYTFGSYQTFAIGSDGTVTAKYSNGQTQAVGQLALANVTNLEGLALQGNGDYATTPASGTASVGVSGTNGLATIQDSSLEMSNVNISAEFSNLIIAQRGFEANSKAITTFDTITQETINMIH
jgi:flagellar hook protein FlgE